jgi:hypothetical protein
MTICFFSEKGYELDVKIKPMKISKRLLEIKGYRQTRNPDSDNDFMLTNLFESL